MLDANLFIELKQKLLICLQVLAKLHGVYLSLRSRTTE